MKNKIYRIMWVGGIYLLLIIILYLVIIYKVKYEDFDFRNYLYFYNCSDNLCTTTNKVSDYYSKYLCEEDCPNIKRILPDNLVILKDTTKEIIYNYQEGKVINKEYNSYEPILINNSIRGYIVSNNQKVGIINPSMEIVAKLEYDKIGTADENGNIFTYQDTYIKALKDDKWGVISFIDGSIKLDFTYSYNYFEVE